MCNNYDWKGGRNGQQSCTTWEQHELWIGCNVLMRLLRLSKYWRRPLWPKIRTLMAAEFKRRFCFDFGQEQVYKYNMTVFPPLLTNLLGSSGGPKSPVSLIVATHDDAGWQSALNSIPKLNFWTLSSSSFGRCVWPLAHYTGPVQWTMAALPWENVTKVAIVTWAEDEGLVLLFSPLSLWRQSSLLSGPLFVPFFRFLILGPQLSGS